MKRREFVRKSAVMGMMAPFLNTSNDLFATAIPMSKEYKNTICTFSKTFQWLDYEEMAGFLSEAGYEGIDLSVRPGGHVLPENIGRDLPKAVKAAQKYGLTIPMMVTSIVDASDPVTEKVLKAASENGIKYYRLGYYRYDNKLSSEANLDAIREKLKALCELNAKYGLQGGYQNHAGTNVGSPVWDLWYMIKDLDPRYIGCQYDVRHAVAEGFGSWSLGYKAVSPHVKHECIKDLTFVRNDQGKWGIRSVPLGTGVVDFERYFKMRQESGIDGPLSIHYEFPLEGDDDQLPKTERMRKILPAVRKEVETLRKLMNK